MKGKSTVQDNTLSCYELGRVQDDNGGFEFIGNAFKITGAVGDIDDLKKVFSISSELLSETTVKAEKDGDSMGLEAHPRASGQESPRTGDLSEFHPRLKAGTKIEAVEVWYEDKEYEKAEKATAFNWWNVNPIFCLRHKYGLLEEKVPERRTTLWRAGKSHLQLGAPGSRTVDRGGRYTGPDRAATASEKRDLAARQIQRALRRREQAKTGRCISVVALSGEVIYEAELREDLSIYQLKGEIANAKGLRRGQVQLSTDRKLEEHVKLKDVPEEDHRNLKPRPLVLTFTRVQDVSEIQSNATRRIAGAWFRHRRG
ncbi:unnamed protein product [Durusdinium trenchii]|uniref:Uncharacterized protein n=1 Tax=Durusdinium trenchii TaxID=1381693 RepID=A0ABP0SYI5_9DINO